MSKNLIALLMVGLLTFCLVGCGAKQETGRPEDYAPTDSGSANADATREQEADMDEPVIDNEPDVDIATDSSITTTQSGDGYTYSLCHGDVVLSLKTDIWQYIHNGVWDQERMLEDFGFELADCTDSANRWFREDSNYPLQTRIMSTGDGYAGYIDFIRYVMRDGTRGKERDEVYRIDVSDGHEVYRSTFGSKELYVPIELIVLFAKCAEDDFSDVAMLSSFESSPYVEYTANGYAVHE